MLQKQGAVIVMCYICVTGARDCDSHVLTCVRGAWDCYSHDLHLCYRMMGLWLPCFTSVLQEHGTVIAMYFSMLARIILQNQEFMWSFLNQVAPEFGKDVSMCVVE